MRMWLALLASAVILVGSGIFFATQSLGRADQYASVASFFLALLTAVTAVFSLLHSRSKPQVTGGTGDKAARPPRRTTVLNLAWRNKAVQYGSHSTMNITNTPEKKSQKGQNA